MKKRIGSLFLLIFAVFIIMPSDSFAQGDIGIVLNGRRLEMDVNPYIKDGRTMVPVRFIVEALGGSAEPMTNSGFPKKYQQFISVMDQRYIDAVGLDLFIDRKVCLSGECAYKMDTAPEIVKGRTMVPLRFIADYLRFDVRWDAESRTVFLTEINKDESPGIDRFQKSYYRKGTEALSRCIESGFTEKNLAEVFN